MMSASPTTAADVLADSPTATTAPFFPPTPGRASTPSSGSPSLLLQSPVASADSLAGPGALRRTATGSSTSASAAASSASKQPNVEIYGFVIYLGSFVGFATFILWAFLPDDVLHGIGITYYPSKWWALSLPLYILVVAGFFVLFQLAYCFIATAPLDSINTITDEYAKVIDNLGTQTFKHEDKVPELLDVPISVVNRCLYHPQSTADTQDASTRRLQQRR